MSLPPNRSRNTRQRKKMHIAEFQELGFEYEIAPAVELPIEEQEALMVRFLDEVIETRNLALGGWLSDGFITSFPRGSATEDDRKAVEAWLSKQFPNAKVQVSELKDAWYV